MAVFNFLTLELCLFIGVMLAYSRIRRKRMLPIEMIRDLTVYLIPTQQDFDVLQKSCVKPNPASFGKKAKGGKTQKAKFPMRTLPLNEDILKHCSEYFHDYDFLFMMFLLVIAMISVMCLVKMIVPDSTVSQTNYSLYLTLLTLILVLQMLCKDCFSLGWTRYTDETKVQMLFAIKSYFLVWVVLNYTAVPKMLGLDVDATHLEMN